MASEASGAYGNPGGIEQYAHDGDVDAVDSPYLTDAELGSSGWRLPTDVDNTGKLNDQLIDQMRHWGL